MSAQQSQWPLNSVGRVTFLTNVSQMETRHRCLGGLPWWLQALTKAFRWAHHREGRAMFPSTMNPQRSGLFHNQNTLRHKTPQPGCSGTRQHPVWALVPCGHLASWNRSLSHAARGETVWLGVITSGSPSPRVARTRWSTSGGSPWPRNQPGVLLFPGTHASLSASRGRTRDPCMDRGP